MSSYQCSACKSEVIGTDQPNHVDNECDALVAKFARMLNLEVQAKSNQALAAFGSDLNTRWRGEDGLKRTKAELYSLLDTLTPGNFAAYKHYRHAEGWRLGLTEEAA